MTTPDIKRREWWVDESKKTLASNRYHRLLDKEQLANEKDWDANWFVNPKPDYIHVVELKPTEVIVEREMIENCVSILRQFAPLGSRELTFVLTKLEAVLK